VRVSQAWAGKSWGAFFLPRHGQEVIVEFMEGDPDRPIITGRVHNGDNKPTYPARESPTMSGIVTNSSRGGGGFNALTFTDAAGSEMFYMRAQKDLETHVLHNSTLRVDNDEFQTITRNRIESVGGDFKSTIKGKHIVEVTGDESVTLKANEKREVTGRQSETVKDDVAIKHGKNCAIDVAEQFHLKAKEIILEASANLTIKVGSTTIAIEQGGVAIDAKGDVTVKTTGLCKVEATKTIELKATQDFKADGLKVALTGTSGASLESSGQTVVKGSMVMIN
jgi:type VI secretion system secreted protein VgrG